MKKGVRKVTCLQDWLAIQPQLIAVTKITPPWVDTLDFAYSIHSTDTVDINLPAGFVSQSLEVYAKVRMRGVTEFGNWQSPLRHYPLRVRTAEFHFDLPPELIAQFPAAQRDESRLLVLHRASGQLEHKTFRHILDHLRAGDVLVLNNSRVIPARLRGTNAKTGGAFEILLLEENATNDWWAMMKPGKRARLGTEIKLTETISATVTATNDEGHRRLTFSGTPDIRTELDALGVPRLAT